MTKTYFRVCGNGHVIDWYEPDLSESITYAGTELENLEPAASEIPGDPYCSDCGTQTIIACESCEELLYMKIPSSTSVQKHLDFHSLPDYCRFCGDPYPWTSPVEAEEVRGGEFLTLDSEDINGLFYQELVNEINQCYRVQANEATLILYRKLLESLIYDILSLYCDPAEEIELYYDTESRQKRNFSTLLESLKEKSDELDKFSDPIDDHEFHEQIGEFKENGDTSAHSKENLVTDDEVEKNSEEATHVAKVLFDLRRRVVAGETAPE